MIYYTVLYFKSLEGNYNKTFSDFNLRIWLGREQDGILQAIKKYRVHPSIVRINNSVTNRLSLTCHLFIAFLFVLTDFFIIQTFV